MFMLYYSAHLVGKSHIIFWKIIFVNIYILVSIIIYLSRTAVEMEFLISR